MAVAITLSLKVTPHSLKSLFDVITIDLYSYMWLTNLKNRLAATGLRGK